MSSTSHSSPTPFLKPGERSRTSSAVHSRSRSRQRATYDSALYLPVGQDALLLPEDPSTETNVQLLHEFVHPRHQRDKRRADTEDTLVAPVINEAASEYDSEGEGREEEEEDWEAPRKRQWYRRPSPIWLLATTPISSIAMSATAAPRIEIYTLLACWEHKPEYLPRGCHETPDVSMNNTVCAVTLEDEVPTNVNLFDDSQLPLLGVDTMMVSQSVFTPSYEESDETSKCASDPVVQAAAAKIIAGDNNLDEVPHSDLLTSPYIVLTTTMGVLGCLTTAFWGSLSDRRGRLRVLSIAMVGLLFNDAIFISVYFFSRQLPGGYWFLILGPIIEGLLGGLTSMIAAIHAYIADVSPPGDRSRQFSLGAGLLFVGMAFGPSFGALLVHFTHTPMAVFYLATGVHAVLALYVLTIVPESLPKRTRRANRVRHERRRLEETRAAELEEAEQVEEEGLKRRVVRVLGKTKTLFSFLSPLSVFTPVKVENMGKKRRDWNLVFIAAGYGCSMFVLASYQYKFQYAAATFNWTSEELGYWLSLVGGSRAFYLTLILPFIIKVFNRPKQPIQLPIEPSEPLNASHLMPSEPPSSILVDAPPSPLQRDSVELSSESLEVEPPRTLTPHSPTFDLRLARASLMWEVVCYALIPLAPTAYVFSVVGCLAAWGGGFGPVVQALALEMYMRRNAELKAREGVDGDRDDDDGGKLGEAEIGRLFGALSVVQSMCSQIFGPTLFGLVYMDTVSYFPTAIFWLSTVCVAIALVFMMLVRLPPHSGSHVAGRTVHIPGHIPNSEENSVCEARDV